MAAADGGLRQQSSHIGTPIKKGLSSRAPDELAASMAGVRSSLEAALARQAPRLPPSSSHGHSPAVFPPEVSSHTAISRVAQDACTHRRYKSEAGWRAAMPTREGALRSRSVPLVPKTASPASTGRLLPAPRVVVDASCATPSTVRLCSAWSSLSRGRAPRRGRVGHRSRPSCASPALWTPCGRSRRLAATR